MDIVEDGPMRPNTTVTTSDEKHGSLRQEFLYSSPDMASTDMEEDRNEEHSSKSEGGDMEGSSTERDQNVHIGSEEDEYGLSGELLSSKELVETKRNQTFKLFEVRAIHTAKQEFADHYMQRSPPSPPVLQAANEDSIGREELSLDESDELMFELSDDEHEEDTDNGCCDKNPIQEMKNLLTKYSILKDDNRSEDRHETDGSSVPEQQKQRSAEDFSNLEEHLVKRPSLNLMKFIPSDEAIDPFLDVIRETDDEDLTENHIDGSIDESIEDRQKNVSDDESMDGADDGGEIISPTPCSTQDSIKYQLATSQDTISEDMIKFSSQETDDLLDSSEDESFAAEKHSRFDLKHVVSDDEEQPEAPSKSIFRAEFTESIPSREALDSLKNHDFKDDEVESSSVSTSKREPTLEQKQLEEGTFISSDLDPADEIQHASVHGPSRSWSSDTTEQENEPAKEQDEVQDSLLLADEHSQFDNNEDSEFQVPELKPDVAIEAQPQAMNSLDTHTSSDGASEELEPSNLPDVIEDFTLARSEGFESADATSRAGKSKLVSPEEDLNILAEVDASPQELKPTEAPDTAELLQLKNSFGEPDDTENSESKVPQLTFTDEEDGETYELDEQLPLPVDSIVKRDTSQELEPSNDYDTTEYQDVEKSVSQNVDIIPNVHEATEQLYFSVNDNHLMEERISQQLELLEDQDATENLPSDIIESFKLQLPELHFGVEPSPQLSENDNDDFEEDNASAGLDLELSKGPDDAEELDNKSFTQAMNIESSGLQVPGLDFEVEIADEQSKLPVCDQEALIKEDAYQEFEPVENVNVVQDPQGDEAFARVMDITESAELQVPTVEAETEGGSEKDLVNADESLAEDNSKDNTIIELESAEDISCRR
uniref:Uncharacterized protein n=1 Tax=Chaetoceros debilis TaxID=122233 RepID=A0A7S3VCJ2_9STRA